MSDLLRSIVKKKEKDNTKMRWMQIPEKRAFKVV